MADFERRLRRSEDRAAASVTDHDELGELIRKRTAELLASDEMLALPLPDVPDEEWAAIQAAAKLEQGIR